tara:strand:- start:64 stop:1008 length:945 start_codon:yes stop_codon:yes gene_type:complete
LINEFPQLTFSRLKKLAVCLGSISFFCLSGCSWNSNGEENSDEFSDEIETSEQKLYKRAQGSLRSSNFRSAIEQLEQLESRFPFGRYAEQAQLELIYAKYMTSRLDEANSSAERFIRLHPQHPNIDYAYYLKGLSSFHKTKSIFDNFFQSQVFKRDMEPVQAAYADFAMLLSLFPDSQYSPDVKQRMIHLRNILADYELVVADYYMRRGAYVAAANRARYVLETYPNTLATPEALIVLIECNWRLGLETETNNLLRVLSLNYPDHENFNENGDLILENEIKNRNRSWTNIISLGLLDRPEIPPPINIKSSSGST